MPYVEPTTRATGYFVTAADWNQDVVANVSFLANPPACRVYRSSTQAFAHNTPADVSFNTERYDTDAMWTAASPTRVTITTPGLYDVKAHARFESANDYTRLEGLLLVNGTTGIDFDRIANPGTVNTARVLKLVSTWKFAAADYVTVNLAQLNGAAASRNTEASTGFQCELELTWLGRG